MLNSHFSMLFANTHKPDSAFDLIADGHNHYWYLCDSPGPLVVSAKEQSQDLAPVFGPGFGPDRL